MCGKDSCGVGTNTIKSRMGQRDESRKARRKIQTLRKHGVKADENKEM